MACFGGLGVWYFASHTPRAGGETTAALVNTAGVEISTAYLEVVQTPNSLSLLSAYQSRTLVFTQRQQACVGPKPTFLANRSGDEGQR